MRWNKSFRFYNIKNEKRNEQKNSQNWQRKKDASKVVFVCLRHTGGGGFGFCSSLPSVCKSFVERISHSYPVSYALPALPRISLLYAAVVYQAVAARLLIAHANVKMKGVWRVRKRDWCTDPTWSAAMLLLGRRNVDKREHMLCGV